MWFGLGLELKQKGTVSWRVWGRWTRVAFFSQVIQDDGVLLDGGSFSGFSAKEYKLF